MKNNEIGLLIGGGLLLAGGGLLFMKKFYKHDIVEPSDYRTKTRKESKTVYPDPNNPVKFDIPEDYGIGHQRADQETYHAWNNKSSGGKRTKRNKYIKKSKKSRKTK
jgi:hypothetical protein